MKFEENLRWWVDFSNFFGSFDIEWPNNEHVGALIIMHGQQQIYAQDPSEMSIYKVMHNENVTWYNLLLLTYLQLVYTATTWRRLWDPPTY